MELFKSAVNEEKLHNLEYRKERIRTITCTRYYFNGSFEFQNILKLLIDISSISFDDNAALSFVYNSNNYALTQLQHIFP